MSLASTVKENIRRPLQEDFKRLMMMLSHVATPLSLAAGCGPAKIHSDVKLSPGSYLPGLRALNF
ncbi:jg26918, partial [Pararge aegeria aegeria]